MLLNRNGTCTYADGSSYEGEWQADMRHGWGVLTTGDGQQYEGEWKDNQMHGETFIGAVLPRSAAFVNPHIDPPVSANSRLSMQSSEHGQAAQQRPPPSHTLDTTFNGFDFHGHSAKTAQAFSTCMDCGHPNKATWINEKVELNV
eukprot:GHUV01037818.1.p1 GENE.GHUV01037818.1~~GHUV01037818.1.p1  ORF type:complete len:145 (-),score=16.84 GHUV01037818.1:377-811(-)